MKLALALLTLGAAAARAQGALPGGCSAPDGNALIAVRTATAPAIDGRPDDAVWRVAPAEGDFLMFTPREGAEPTFHSEARFLYDDHALYVMVRANDPRADSIVRRLARRDTFDPTADQILIFLDSYHDHRSGFEFVVTAGGVKSDAILYDDSGEDFSWDGVWDVATAVDSLGWVAEFAIPFHQIRFASRSAPTFGIMVGRWVGRTGERMSMPLYRRSVAGLVSQFGTLAGLRDLTRSGSVELTPYVLTSARNIRETSGGGARVEMRPAVGGDVRWLPRPGLSIDATINPDFGQVEADPAVLNLTGVEVFQSERRPFFLEGAGLLSLPLAADGSGQLFYSRRIGRRPALLDAYGAPESPTETTILGAAKVTARLAPGTSLAALSAITGREEGAAVLRGDGEEAGRKRYVIEPRAHYGVARLQHDFRGGRSGVGVMLTRVDRGAGDSVASALLPSAAQTAAVTTQHQTADGAYQVSARGAMSDVRGSRTAISGMQLSPVHAFQRPDDEVAFDASRTALRGGAAYLSAGKVGRGITRFGVSYRWLSPGFDVNEMGFLTRAGVQTWSANAGIKLNTPGSVLGVRYRRADASIAFSGDWATNGLAYGRGFTLTGTLQRPSQAQLQVTLGKQLSGAFCAAECTRGGPALVDPASTAAMLDLTGDPRRSLVPHARFEWSRDDGGRSHGLTGQVDVTWRIRSNLDASLAAYAVNLLYDTHYYGRFGAALSDTAHYTVARLDQRTRSLTARVNFTIARALTLQWYGEAYVSRGMYANVRELAEPRAHNRERRFRPYGDPAVSDAPGGIDYKQFRSNTVLRWEYRSGSTLFVVWSQGRDYDGREPATPGLWPGHELHDLFALRPRNTVVVKMTYWLSR